MEHFRSKVNIVAIPLGADRVLALKKGGHNEMLLIFCYFVYLVFSVFVSMSFGILHHLLLLSETGQ